jgi:hypothetical protein
MSCCGSMWSLRTAAQGLQVALVMRCLCSIAVLTCSGHLVLLLFGSQEVPREGANVLTQCWLMILISIHQHLPTLRLFS